MAASVEFTLKCSEHSCELEAKWNSAFGYLEVSPCLKCLEDAREETSEGAFNDGYKEGRDAGYDEGKDAGYEEGYQEGLKDGKEQAPVDTWKGRGEDMGR